MDASMVEWSGPLVLMLFALLFVCWDTFGRSFRSRRPARELLLPVEASSAEDPAALGLGALSQIAAHRLRPGSNPYTTPKFAPVPRWSAGVAARGVNARSLTRARSKTRGATYLSRGQGGRPGASSQHRPVAPFFAANQDPSGPVIAVVGATGAVGQELVKCLHALGTPFSRLRLMASARSAGAVADTPFGGVTIEEFSVGAARECDYVLMSVDGGFALEHAPAITRDGGPVVIDNSSAFRYDDEVPLVVPEINKSAISPGSRLIANPNCTTAIAVMPLWPIHQKYKIRKLIVSSYQAASGAGEPGMQELKNGMASALQGDEVENKIFAHPLPFNLVPCIDKFQDNLYTKEEMKVSWEVKKIFGLSDDDIRISVTAVRVPTLRAHAEAITIETEEDIPPDEVRALLATAPGVKVVDKPENQEYPMPLTATEQHDVEVGRIRQSEVFGSKGVDIFVCGDQLLRGAALNAVLILEAMSGRS